MKFAIAAVAALLPFVALSAPTPADDSHGGADVESVKSIEKRDVVGTVDADALKYRRCPRTTCEAVGQYARGTRVTMDCYTTTNTTPVSGNAGWAKLANGYWVSLYYMNWSG
ncbi:hypothetical protein B0O99DRAFT_704061 [Bisporella sp. PMI_857]|nr:hypothetical protein B0O99DRAFT_704061 [Bisporella sp. PMI_857]